MMSNAAKIYLSEQELQLMYNAEIILTKRRIIENVTAMFATISVDMQTLISEKINWLPKEATTIPAKISKGENYLLLPYVMLDYPRIFDRENIFAIRTMFWWGNFFSITLQLSGTYKQVFEQQLLQQIMLHDNNGYFICTNENQWQHHFEQDNYISAKGFSIEKLQVVFSNSSFIKIAIQVPLQQPETAGSLLLNGFDDLMKLIKPSFQDGEKDLSPEIPITGSGL